MFIVNNKSKSPSNGAVPRRPPSHKSPPGITWSFGPNFIGCNLIIIIINWLYFNNNNNNNSYLRSLHTVRRW